jgi:hypothetical protein
LILTVRSDINSRHGLQVSELQEYHMNEDGEDQKAIIHT